MAIESGVKSAYLETLSFMRANGRAPHCTELSRILGESVDRARNLPHAASSGDQA